MKDKCVSNFEEDILLSILRCLWCGNYSLIRDEIFSLSSGPLNRLFVQSLISVYCWGKRAGHPLEVITTPTNGRTDGRTLIRDPLMIKIYIRAKCSAKATAEKNDFTTTTANANALALAPLKCIIGVKANELRPSAKIWIKSSVSRL